LHRKWSFIKKTPKTLPKKLLEPISKFSKVAKYEINIHKSITFLYTNTELAKEEIKSTIKIATKIFTNKFNQKWNVLCTNNYKTIEYNYKKKERKISHVHGLEELTLLQCSYYLK
jgi:hypothetical protein